MENTIKLLKFSLSMLQLALVLLVLTAIGQIITGIVLAVQFDLPSFIWISVSSFITMICIAIVNVFIRLTEGSIKEHAEIIERVDALDGGAPAPKEESKPTPKPQPKPIVKPQPVIKEPEVVEIEESVEAKEEIQEEEIEEATPIEEPIEKQPQEVVEPVKPKPIVIEEPQPIRVKPSNISIKDKKIIINGKTFDAKKVEELSVLGSELHFMIAKDKYIVEFDYFSEASKMYDEIDAQ